MTFRRRDRRPQRFWVYVADCVDAPFVKVGYTNSRPRRLRENQTGCAYVLEYVQLWEFVTEHDARTIEGGAHLELDGYPSPAREFNGRNELFRCDPGTATDAVRRSIANNDRWYRRRVLVPIRYRVRKATRLVRYTVNRTLLALGCWQVAELAWIAITDRPELFRFFGV